jgi:hypothetical protein
MLWVTWRQQRTQTLVTGALVVLAAVALAITGTHLASLYTSVSSCQANCTAVVSAFRNDAQSGFSGLVYHFSIYAMYLVPPLIGAFWGAPLVARELEAGTHRLAWSQTVTRRRWLATKLAVGGALAMLATGILSLGATLALHHLDHGQRIQPELFGVRGIAPVAYTAFAFALGVAAGTILRRTVVAMAVTLAVYIIAAVLMPTVVRAHLLPTRTATEPVSGARDSVFEMHIDQQHRMKIIGTLHVPGSWPVSNRTVLPDGSEFAGPADPNVCGPNASPQACSQWISTLHLRQVLSYQPASHYWPLQWTESGIFVVLALLLAGVAMWWTRRRLS